MSRVERVMSLAQRLSASRTFQVGFVLTAVAGAAVAIVLDRESFVAAARELGAAPLLAALGFTVVNVLAAAQAWRTVLADLGSALDVRTAFRVFLVGSLGKYLPGSVWFLIAQMELAARYGVPRPRAASASVVTLVLTVATALMASLAIIPFAPGALPPYLGWVQLLLPLLVVALYPPLLNGTLNRALGRLGRPALEHEVSGLGTLRAVLWSLTSWLAIGAQVAVLAITVGAPFEGRTVALCLGGYALAWALGFATVIAPAGAGAREAVLLLVLAAVLSPGSALVVVLVSRLLLTLSDLALAGAFGVRLAGSGAPEGEVA